MATPPVAATKLAAQYLRMSTVQQAFSIERQAEAIAAYAAFQGLEIVHTYEDRGVSGLSLIGREGLRRLLAEVLAGDPGFEVLLVYDVSRWGRFQDPDQAAHYEFLCRQAGVAVEYCAEPFRQDASVSSGLIKQLKRAMAAEYSRDVSARVIAAKANFPAKGFWQGAPAPFALRRVVLEPGGQPGRVLAYGERKCIPAARVVLIPGPDEEVRTLRRIFRLYALERRSPAYIMRLLTAEGVQKEGGRGWSRNGIMNMLTNELYVGVLVVGKTSERLKARRFHPPSEWRRYPAGYPPLVSKRLFELAQRRLGKRRLRVSDDELIAQLRRVLKRHGRITCSLINAVPDAHSASTICTRFGGLERAYELAGYAPNALQRGAWRGCRSPKRQTRAIADG
jgi:DNA invertase Pin-like site-specific DNA recombinase